MRPRLTAFTLVELLIVLAIIMVLAGLLFPVFRGVKAKAREVSCLSQYHQAHIATFLYLDDYDSTVMPVNYRPGNPNSSQHDRTWVQVLLPYVKSFDIFKCPSDYTQRPSTESTFDKDLVPGDTDTRYYTASMRSNLGYNYAYLAPVYRDVNGSWHGAPRNINQVADPSRTLLYVDSVWQVNEQGQPEGGGSWLVVPPCRYIVGPDGRVIDSFQDNLSFKSFYTPLASGGWNPHRANAADRYGFTWPWHEGRMSVVTLDGHAEAVRPQKLMVGCDVKARWTGMIKDPVEYPWDLR